MSPSRKKEEMHGRATRPALRIRLDSVSVSGVLLTICLLIIARWNLKFAATLGTRYRVIGGRIAMPNYEASIAFASLALVVIGLIVVWTGYQKRMRWSWFIMVVFVCVYFVPVHLLDVFLDIRRVGWPWWPGVVQDAMEGRPFAVGALKELAIFTLMVIALLVPIKAFFGEEPTLPSGDQSKT
jgi:hypothetical protein